MADEENRISKQSRKQYSPAFKAKVALEAIREVATVAELAAKYPIYPSLIHTWKRQWTEAAADVFEKGTQKDEPEVDTQELYRQIGQLKLPRGFMYLVTVMDGYSRKVFSWRLSNTLEADFCVEALAEALALYGKPEIFNTDQGCQFTSEDFLGVLEAQGIRISMDGRGRWVDNVFVERLWRSVKYEDVYLKGYETGKALREGLKAYFLEFNGVRLHQSLGDKTPDETYYEKQPEKKAA